MSLMNESNEEMENGISSAEYIYVILTAVTAGLSMFGGTCICILYFAFKDIRSPSRQLLLYLAFSDAMLAFGNLLGVIWFLYGDSLIIHYNTGYCTFQSAMTIYFSTTSFIWTVIIASSLFAIVVLLNVSFTAKYMKLFHILAWIPGGIIVFVAVSLNVLGTDTTLHQASWCWIDPRVPNALLWQFVTGKLLEILAYITTVVMYSTVKIFLMRQAKISLALLPRKRARAHIMVEASRKLTFVPLVFIVCRIWGTLRFLLGHFAHDIINEPYVTWINPLQGIGDSAQGFANFLFYCYLTEKVRSRLFRCCYTKIADVSKPVNACFSMSQTVSNSSKNDIKLPLSLRLTSQVSHTTLNTNFEVVGTNADPFMLIQVKRKSTPAAAFIGNVFPQGNGIQEGDEEPTKVITDLLTRNDGK